MCSLTPSGGIDWLELHRFINQMVVLHFNKCHIGSYTLSYILKNKDTLTWWLIKCYSSQTFWNVILMVIHHFIPFSAIKVKNDTVIYHGSSKLTSRNCFTCVHHNPSNQWGIHNYAMVVCRSHDTAGSLAHGVFISRPTHKLQSHLQNPDLLVKSRSTCKIQTYWLGHKALHSHCNT